MRSKTVKHCLEITKDIEKLESCIQDAHKGLPEDIFLFISRLTPLINVDLLIKNKQNHTLLTWRDDGYWVPGWHIPGGIIRYKETIAKRIEMVAATELGVNVRYKDHPLAINEFILSEKNRGHFISLLYECDLIGDPNAQLKFVDGIPKLGEWKWHARCPDNLISIHEIYRKYI